MGRDFFSQLPGRAANLGGLTLDVATILEAAQSPAALQTLLYNQSLIGSDPNARAALERSPFLAGAFGYPVHAQPPAGTPAGLEHTGLTPEQARTLGVEFLGQTNPLAGPGEAPGRRDLRPSLPPLPDVAGQVRRALAGAAPGTRYSVPIPGVQGGRISEVVPGSRPTGRVLLPGETEEVDPATGLIFGVDPTTGIRRVLGKATEGEGAKANARLQAQLDATAKAAGYTDANDARFRPYIQGLLGIPAPAALEPTGRPQPTRPGVGGVPPIVQPPATAGGLPQAPRAAVPSDDTPVGQLAPAPPAPAEPRRGYPSPAFIDQPSAAPVPATPARPTALPPPGTTRSQSFRLGPFSTTSRQTGPPTPGKAAPAIVQRQLSLLNSSSQAAKAALDILERGPQHPLTLMGSPVGRVPGFAGPVTGRALQALTRVSGQPLAQEEASLAALIAHARAGVTSLTGLRFTEQQMKLFEPLMPDLAQPKEVLAVHLRRLSRFYDSLAQQQAALSNLSPAQQQAVTQALFQTVLSGVDEGPGTAGPGAVDLRR